MPYVDYWFLVAQDVKVLVREHVMIPVRQTATDVEGMGN